MGMTIVSESTVNNGRQVSGTPMREPESAAKLASSDAAVSPAPRRGRPKGARTTTLTEARRQAADEKAKLKRDFSKINDALQGELEVLQNKYDRDMAQLNDELEIFKRREASYRLALGERLHEVADYLQTTLLSWGDAELEEAVIDKRGRGRPRKTLK